MFYNLNCVLKLAKSACVEIYSVNPDYTLTGLKDKTHKWEKSVYIAISSKIFKKEIK